MTERHQGRPLARLMEFYVLWAIGELAPADDERLQGMAPKLRSIYQVEGSWQDVLAAVMQVPAELPDELRRMWLKNLEIARSNGVELPPQHFAEMVVDQNFAGQQ